MFLLANNSMYKFSESSSSKQKAIECPTCNRPFVSRSIVNDYMHKKKKYTYPKSYKCEVCLKCFASKSSLVMHTRTHTGEKPFACATCGKRFATKSVLQNHEATHSDERKFKCEVCPDHRGFKTKNDLGRHMVYHYDPKHSCVKCSKKFYTSSALRWHEKRNKC